MAKILLHNPDLVDLDIRLVGWGGLELSQDIRNPYYKLPVILCSAYDTYKVPRPLTPLSVDGVKIIDYSRQAECLSVHIRQGHFGPVYSITCIPMYLYRHQIQAFDC